MSIPAFKIAKRETADKEGYNLELAAGSCTFCLEDCDRLCVTPSLVIATTSVSWISIDENQRLERPWTFGR
jgi:hypothetical protein